MTTSHSEKRSDDPDIIGVGMGGTALPQIPPYARNDIGRFYIEAGPVALVGKEDDSQEENNEAGPAGQVLGYISLNQARVLATRRALALGLAAAGLAVVAGAAIAVFLSVSNPSLTVAPPDEATTTVFVTPHKAASLVSPDGDVRVDLIEGSVASPVEFSYRRISPVGIPQLPAGFIPTSKVFDLSVSAQEGPVRSDFSFVKPVTLTIQLSAQDAALSGGIEKNVAIHHFKVGGAGWTTLSTKVDFAAATAQAQVDSLSVFALAIKQSRPEAKLVAGGQPLRPDGYAAKTLPNWEGRRNWARVKPGPSQWSLEPQGTPLGDADLRIRAIALARA